MDKDYGELIEYLDKKFNKLEEDINNLRVKVFDNSNGIKEVKEQILAPHAPDP